MTAFAGLRSRFCRVQSTASRMCSASSSGVAVTESSRGFCCAAKALLNREREGFGARLLHDRNPPRNNTLFLDFNKAFLRNQLPSSRPVRSSAFEINEPNLVTVQLAKLTTSVVNSAPVFFGDKALKVELMAAEVRLVRPGPLLSAISPEASLFPSPQVASSLSPALVQWPATRLLGLRKPSRDSHDFGTFDHACPRASVSDNWMGKARFLG